jgi:hypothetical protein
MKEYKCTYCNKIFDRKSNYEDHNNRKKSCFDIEKNAEKLQKNCRKLQKTAENEVFFAEKRGFLEEKKLNFTEKQLNFSEKQPNFTEKQLIFSNNPPENLINLNCGIKLNQISTETLAYYMERYQCGYCLKHYTRKNTIKNHIKDSCKVKKEIEKKRELIFEDLKLKELEKENQILKLKEEIKKENYEMKKDYEKKINKLEKKLEKQAKIINHNIDNTMIINDNSQHLYLLNYNNENLSNLNENKVIANLNRGYQAPVEMTRLIHFDEEHPEHHNIYIPKINEKYAMVFKDDVWKLMDKNVLVDDIFENKKDYIIENLEKFIKRIDPKRLKSLKLFLNSEEYEIGIINTKENIKNLLYENRHLAMERKKEIDTKNKKKTTAKLFK